jgi:hypothetical protein
MAMVGGKDKTKIRNATPPEFRDMLITMARSCLPNAEVHRAVPAPVQPLVGQSILNEGHNGFA